jgi:hypothetical protein
MTRRHHGFELFPGLPAVAVVAACIAACASDSETAAGAGEGAGSGAAGGAANGDPFANAPPVATGEPATAPTLAGDPGDATCAQGLANTSPITPTVWLVLDGSGSMDESFDGGDTRWQALRSVLMDGGGVVPALEQSVRFGMVLYAGIDQDQQPQGGLCVDLEIVEPALNNFATLDGRFPQQELGGWTPTDSALEHVVNSLPAGGQDVLDAMVEPTYVILATDGAPNDRCNGEVDNGSGRGGQNSGLDPVVAARVLEAARRGAAQEMNLFVISLAGGDDTLQAHLDEVAATSRTGAAPFVPATRDDLVATLRQIIGDATCRVELDGSVAAGGECSGEVVLNGTPLTCNSDDGFRMLDERTLQLTGTACDTFLGSASQVHASFSCGVFTPD